MLRECQNLKKCQNILFTSVGTTRGQGIIRVVVVVVVVVAVVFGGATHNMGAREAHQHLG